MEVFIMLLMIDFCIGLPNVPLALEHLPQPTLVVLPREGWEDNGEVKHLKNGEIETINELVESKLVFGLTVFFRKYFETSPDYHYWKILNRSVHCPHYGVCLDRAGSLKDMALPCSQSYVDMMAARYKGMVVPMPRPIVTQHTVMYTTKHNPLAGAISAVVLDLRESGILRKWWTQLTTAGASKAGEGAGAGDGGGEPQPMTLSHLQGAFLLLALAPRPPPHVCRRRAGAWVGSGPVTWGRGLAGTGAGVEEEAGARGGGAEERGDGGEAGWEDVWEDTEAGEGGEAVRRREMSVAEERRDGEEEEWRGVSKAQHGGRRGRGRRSGEEGTEQEQARRGGKW
ncbi:Uncharacterized protein GBIM_07874 [Gryllus bimaculatus]|nr:Uncharacterized protein GBIM_07874 [Gryllus bimaculatus]